MEEKHTFVVNVVYKIYYLLLRSWVVEIPEIEWQLLQEEIEDFEKHDGRPSYSRWG